MMDSLPTNTCWLPSTLINQPPKTIHSQQRIALIQLLNKLNYGLLHLQNTQTRVSINYNNNHHQQQQPQPLHSYTNMLIQPTSPRNYTDIHYNNNSKNNNNNNNNNSNNTNNDSGDDCIPYPLNHFIPIHKSGIECGNIDPTTGERRMYEFSTYFNRKLEIYTAQADPQQRILYRASVLSEKFDCATNKIGMYLARRRHSEDGLYQATHFVFKPAGRTGLKSGGYFLSLAVCQKFEVHFLKQAGKKKIKADNNNNCNNNSDNNNNAKQIKDELHSDNLPSISLVDSIFFDNAISPSNKRIKLEPVDTMHSN